MKLALGSVQFGLKYGVANTSGQVSRDAVRAILHRAQLSGLNTLDTANAYGESESVLGCMGVQNWLVVTKLPAVPTGCLDVAQWVKSETLASMRRLRVTGLYGLLLHRPEQLLGAIGEDLFGALQSIKAQGLVKNIGMSIYGPVELDALCGRYAFDLVQAPLNLVDRSLVTSGWAQQLQNAGVEVHTRSAYLQGLLLMPKDKRPIKFERWRDIWTEWDNWLETTRLTPLQACLRYTHSLDCIDRVVVGVDSVAQLEEAIAAVQGALPSLPKFKTLQADRLINPATWNHL